MSFVKRVRQMSGVPALLIGLAFVVSASAEERKVTDMAQLAGKWKGWTTTNDATKLTIQPNGTYSALTYYRSGARTFTGRFFLEGGTIRFKKDQGMTGSYVVLVEKGKRLLKGTRDDRPGVTTEYEEVK